MSNSNGKHDPEILKNGNGIPGDEDTGGLGGDSYEVPKGGARDTRMIERAVKGGWDIPDVARKLIPTELTKIAVARNPDNTPYKAANGENISPRNQIAAARVLALMNQQNQAAEKAESGEDQPQVQVNVGVQVANVLDSLQNDPAYIKAAQDRAMAESAVAPGVTGPENATKNTTSYLGNGRNGHAETNGDH